MNFSFSRGLRTAANMAVWPTERTRSIHVKRSTRFAWDEWTLGAELHLCHVSQHCLTRMSASTLAPWASFSFPPTRSSCPINASRATKRLRTCLLLRGARLYVSAPAVSSSLHLCRPSVLSGPMSRRRGPMHLPSRL